MAAVSLPAGPPEYPDWRHVVHGCYLSSVAYLHRYLADFPAEQGRMLTVATMSPLYPYRHTVALVSHRGKWWLRDEYYGVVALGASVREAATEGEIKRQAETVLNAAATYGPRAGIMPAMETKRGELTAAERRSQVTMARQLLPLPSEVVSVRCPEGDLSFLYFRVSAEQIAVYEPGFGTASARTPCSDPVAVVQAVAGKLGLQLHSARLDGK